eukprot:scaffold20168_cov20-Tisochrysis_lutea.AAC.4
MGCIVQRNALIAIGHHHFDHTSTLPLYILHHNANCHQMGCIVQHTDWIAITHHHIDHISTSPLLILHHSADRSNVAQLPPYKFVALQQLHYVMTTTTAFYIVYITLHHAGVILRLFAIYAHICPTFCCAAAILPVLKVAICAHIPPPTRFWLELHFAFTFSVCDPQRNFFTNGTRYSSSLRGAGRATPTLKAGAPICQVAICSRTQLKQSKQ